MINRKSFMSESSKIDFPSIYWTFYIKNQLLGIVERHLSQRLWIQFFNFFGGFEKLKSLTQLGHCL